MLFRSADASEFGNFTPGQYYLAPENIKVKKNYLIIWNQAENIGQSDMGEQVDDPQIMQFSPEEIENLKEIFFLFDKEKVGQIKLSDLEAIMQSL